MNYIGEAIDYLKNYENMQRALENLEMDIKELKANINAGQIGAIEYSDMPKGGGNSLPGDEIINNLYVLQVKRRQYSLTKRAIEKMDLVLSKLPPEDEKILRYWYIDGLRGDTVYEHTNCSERNFYRCKNQALKTFAIQLHGLPAV
jgi:hypothetical protein